MNLPRGKISFNRAEWLAAMAITVAILWLHVHFWRNVGGLWRDEVNTINLAQSHSLVVMTHDTFPILSAGLLGMWTWLGFGGTDSGLRFAGMLFGLAIPAAFWAVARTTRRPPLFSLTLFGLNSLFICFGDSLRAYGLGSALLVLTAAAMWSLLKNPDWARAVLLALAATASVQALYQNSVLFFGICLGAFAVCLQRKDLPTAVKIISAGTVAALSLLPYYRNFIGLNKVSVELRRGFSPLITSLNFRTAAGFPFEQYAGIWEMLAVIMIGLTLLSLSRPKSPGNNSDDSLHLFASVTLVSVLVIFIAFLWFAGVSAPPWYFIPPLAVVVVCFDCGLGLSALPRRAGKIVFGCLIVTAAVSVPVAQGKLNVHFTNVDRLAARVAARASPEDYVVVTPWFCGLTFERYFHAPIAWQTLPPLASHSTHRYDLVLKQMVDTNSLAPVFEKIATTLRSGHRVWVVGTLPTLRTNAMEPPVLPPPPLPGFGWSDSPYQDSWAGRTEFYLRRHSVRFEAQADDRDNGVNLQENQHLYLAEGWRD